MFIETAKGLLTAAEIYDKRNTVSEMFRWFRLRLPGVPRVLVFGAGGTGKSTLGRMLAGALDTDRSVLPYVETPGITSVSSAGEKLRAIRIAPGQEDRRPGNWDELYQDLSKGTATRVVNVVAWGHHATKLERTALRTFRQGMSGEEFKHEYFDANRALELAALREIVPHLKSAPGHLHVLTFITKQDLWWDERYNVKEHYSTGEYAELIQSVREHKGAANFHHEVISAALVQQNLRTADGYTISATVSGYDDPLRLTNLESAAKVLEEFFA